MNLSILVSVYNQKPEYLKRCVDSLPREAEIIIIDDGSTIPVRTDAGIIYHCPHQGLAASRSFGIEKATKDFITFVDSDDFIETPDSFNKILSWMEQDPDIGIGVIGTKTENPTDHLHRAMKDTIMDRQEAFLDLTFGRHYSWHVWGKVYRREILLATNQEIDSSVSLGEDLERNLYAFPRAKKVAYDSEHFYHYIFNEEGMCRKSRGEKTPQPTIDTFNRIMTSPFMTDKARRILSIKFSIRR